MCGTPSVRWTLSFIRSFPFLGNTDTFSTYSSTFNSRLSRPYPLASTVAVGMGWVPSAGALSFPSRPVDTDWSTQSSRAPPFLNPPPPRQDRKSGRGRSVYRSLVGVLPGQQVDTFPFGTERRVPMPCPAQTPRSCRGACREQAPHLPTRHVGGDAKPTTRQETTHHSPNR